MKPTRVSFASNTNRIPLSNKYKISQKYETKHIVLGLSNYSMNILRARTAHDSDMGSESDTTRTQEN